MYKFVPEKIVISGSSFDVIIAFQVLVSIILFIAFLLMVSFPSNYFSKKLTISEKISGFKQKSAVLYSLINIFVMVFLYELLLVNPVTVGYGRGTLRLLLIFFILPIYSAVLILKNISIVRRNFH